MLQITPTHCALLHRFSSVSPFFSAERDLQSVSHSCISAMCRILSQNRGSRILMFWLQLCVGQQKIYTIISTYMKRGKEKRHCDKSLCDGVLCFFENIRVVAEYLLVTCVSTILKPAAVDTTVPGAVQIKTSYCSFAEQMGNQFKIYCFVTRHGMKNFSKEVKHDFHPTC